MNLSRYVVAFLWEFPNIYSIRYKFALLCESGVKIIYLVAFHCQIGKAADKYLNFLV